MRSKHTFNVAYTNKVPDDLQLTANFIRDFCQRHGFIPASSSFIRSLHFNIRTLRAFLQGQRHNKAGNHQDGREVEAVVDAACEAQGFASG